MYQIENLASNQKRIGSFVIDDLVVSILFVAIFFDQLGALNSSQDAMSFVNSNFWVLILLKVSYHTFFTWQNGKTLGKYIMKIQTVSIEGQYLLSLPMAFLRSVVRILDETFFYVGFLPAFFSPTRQTLHDRISRSIVINA